MSFAHSTHVLKTENQIKGQSGYKDHSMFKVQNPNPNRQHPPKPIIRTQKTWMFFAPSKSRQRAEIQNICVSKTSDQIQVKMGMPNPSQEPPMFSEAPWMILQH